ncbi:unnamed protein product [Sphagnum compactum]
MGRAALTRIYRQGVGARGPIIAMKYLQRRQDLATRSAVVVSKKVSKLAVKRKSAFGAKGIYLPAFVIVVLSAVAQYYQSKQLLPAQKDQRSLRQILKSAGGGEQADQAEVNAAVGQSTRFLLAGIYLSIHCRYCLGAQPVLVNRWVVAYIQQSIVLRREDEVELEAIENKPQRDVTKIPEAELVNEAIAFAKRYLEDLLSFFGLNSDVEAVAEDSVIKLNVPSTNLNGFLIGQRGETMRRYSF